MVIAIDACLWKHLVSQIYFLILNIIDGALRFHVATVLKSGPNRHLLQLLIRRTGRCVEQLLDEILTKKMKIIKFDADGMEAEKAFDEMNARAVVRPAMRARGRTSCGVRAWTVGVLLPTDETKEE